MVDKTSLFSAGIVDQVVDNALCDPRIMMGAFGGAYAGDFTRLTMYELFAYNTSCFCVCVESAKQAGVTDAGGLLARLCFYRRLARLGGTSHGVVPFAGLRKLLSASVVVAPHAGFHIGIMRSGDADAEHHFVVTWFVRT